MIKGIWLMALAATLPQVVMLAGYGSATTPETVRLAVLVYVPISAAILSLCALKLRA